MTGTRQLVLDFPVRPALGQSDFLVGDCNRDAVGWIDRWPDWRAPALVIWGPEGCGKTHLAHVWRARNGSVFLSGSDLSGREPAELLGDTACCAVDDADPVADEEALLHLYNSVAELDGHLLLTARRPPSRWSLALADLASRLGAAPAVAVLPPDDALLGALLVKLCHDRQLVVGDEVLVYLLARMERSFAAARKIVAALDTRGLSERRRITVPLAREVLDRLDNEENEQGEEGD